MCPLWHDGFFSCSFFSLPRARGCPSRDLRTRWSAGVTTQKEREWKKKKQKEKKGASAKAFPCPPMQKRPEKRSPRVPPLPSPMHRCLFLWACAWHPGAKQKVVVGRPSIALGVRRPSRGSLWSCFALLSTVVFFDVSVFLDYSHPLAPHALFPLPLRGSFARGNPIPHPHPAGPPSLPPSQWRPWGKR